MSGESTLEQAWVAAQAFVSYGDVHASKELYYALQASLDTTTGPVNIAHTLAPQLLQRCLTLSSIGGSNSTPLLLFASVMNRLFCVRLLPLSLAQSRDRRPIGIAELLVFYLSVLIQPLPAPVRRQLVQCQAMLLLLQEEGHSAAESLCRIAQGTSADTATAAEHTLHLFISMVDLLSDPRVPIGPLRRTKERRELQSKGPALVLECGSLAPSVAVEALGRVVAFFSEQSTSSAQDVAPEFWLQLPHSSMWACCLHAAASGCSTPSVEVESALDVVCGVLRSLTYLDDAAELLLSTALGALLDGNAADPTATARVCAAALEASVESVVLDCSPDSALFLLFSRGAERLASSMADPSLACETQCTACEGIAALAQALYPAPLPEMDSTDDPEDFELFIELVREQNSGKAAALDRLRSFLKACQAVLVSYMQSHVVSAGRLHVAAAHALERSRNSNGVDDYTMYFEDPELAYVYTYERLCSVIGAPDLSAECHSPALCALAQMWSSTLSSHLLTSSDPCTLVGVADLLPVMATRHTHEFMGAMPSFCAIAEAAIRAGDAEAVVLALDGLRILGKSAAKSTEGTRLLPSCSARAGQIALAALALSSSADTQGCMAEHVAFYAEHHFIVLPESTLTQLQQLPVAARLELLSCFPAATSSVAALSSTLVLLSELNQLATTASTTSHRVEAVKRIAQRLTTTLAAGVATHAWDAAQLKSLLLEWHEHNVANSIVSFLTLTTALPAVCRPAVQLHALKRFFFTAGSECDCALESIITPEVCRTVAGGGREFVGEVQTLLLWLLQSRPDAWSCAGSATLQRLLLLARCATALQESDSCDGVAMAEVFCLLVARLQEIVSCASVLAEAEGAEENEVEEAIFSELAVLGRCLTFLPHLPQNIPAWAVEARLAVDDFERRAVLKRAVS